MSLKDKIKKLLNVIKDTEIEEIEVSSFWGAQKIRLSKKSNSNNYIQHVPTGNVNQVNIAPDNKQSDSSKEVLKSDSSNIDSANEIKKTDEKLEEDLIYQNAPLVGTFYAAPKPGEPKFIEIGQKVVKGQTLCIIEAMKIFNEIESDFDGEIVEVLAKDSSPVEFNQPIFSLRKT